MGVLSGDSGALELLQIYPTSHILPLISKFFSHFVKVCFVYIYSSDIITLYYVAICGYHLQGFKLGLGRCEILPA